MFGRIGRRLITASNNTTGRSGRRWLSTTSTGSSGSGTFGPAIGHVRQPLTVLRLPRMPIWQQLKIEEALLRADDRNWCIINQPRRIHTHSLPFEYYSNQIDPTSSERAIVLGLSGDAHSLVNLKRAESDGVPLIRRFSGGGTVYGMLLLPCAVPILFLSCRQHQSSIAIPFCCWLVVS